MLFLKSYICTTCIKHFASATMMTLFDFLLNLFEGDDCYALFDMNRGSHCSLAQDTAFDPKENLCGLRGKKPCHCNDMKKIVTCNFTFVLFDCIV